MPRKKRHAGEVAAPADGELEHDLNRDDEDREDDQVLAAEAEKKLERERKLKAKRNERYNEKKRAERSGAAADADAEVDKTLHDDPELAKAFHQFAGKIGSAQDLAAAYALFFAPFGILLHEDFQLFDEASGEPTAECMQLAKGTWPVMKKYAGPWLAWVRTHSPEVLAIVTVAFFASRKLPTVVKLVEDPSRLRINRLRSAAAAAATEHPPPHPQGAAAAAQVIDMQREPGKQEAV